MSGHTRQETALAEALRERAAAGLLRSLSLSVGTIDLCSNDYLGNARALAAAHPESGVGRYGATGSRLLSGNSGEAEDLEREIAEFHGAEAALLFNSGFDANLALLSTVPQRGDTIIFDQRVHASIRVGIKLSNAYGWSFEHNNLSDLAEKIQRARGRVYVVVESVYSMDGDIAPLVELCALTERLGAALIVDEAHALGVFGREGRGVMNEIPNGEGVFARVYTFGKALGAHGAAIVGSATLRSYLINFAHSFIYTTALPLPALAAIRIGYKFLRQADLQRQALRALIHAYRESRRRYALPESEASYSAIQTVLLPGNQCARSVSATLQARDFDIRAILSPTVPAGRERLRISLHSFNTVDQVEEALRLIAQQLTHLKEQPNVE